MALAFVLAAIWLLNSGHYTPLLLMLMLCSTLFVVLLARRMDLIDRESVPLRVIGRMLPFSLWLGRQLVLANIDVVKRIWAGPASVDPVLARMPIDQKTDVGRVLLANAITLTPGTITVAVDEDYVTVHALTREGWEALRDGDLDQRVRRLES